MLLLIVVLVSIGKGTSYNSFDEFRMVTIVHKQLCD
jgi:hypothetical protein